MHYETSTPGSRQLLAKATPVGGRVRVTWVKSGINRLKIHRATLRALGFTHLNQVVEHDLSAQVKGMLQQVGYLCLVEKA